MRKPDSYSSCSTPMIDSLAELAVGAARVVARVGLRTAIQERRRSAGRAKPTWCVVIEG